MNIAFEQDPKRSRTRYMGRWERVAVVFVDGARVDLGLADTSRCAKDSEAAATTLRSIAERLDIDDDGIEAAAAQLVAHCRAISGWRERRPRR